MDKINRSKATARAHANIALVKYWGKRDSKLNLPMAGSLSLTLDGLNTTTTVEFGVTERDTLIIEGTKSSEEAVAKAMRVVDQVRRLASIDSPIRIDSVTTFPIGAGLASSASGLAALTVAAAHAAGLRLSTDELSRIARIGSGSACRSIFGGFVEWHRGERDDGYDSVAECVAPAEHWDLRVLVAVVAREKKAVNSTTGMNHTRDTSPYFFPYHDQVKGDLAQARRVIEDRDFYSLGRIAERSCLRMHASMMAADPALIYLTSDSWRVIESIEALKKESVDVFFTADAGPNIKAFCTAGAFERVERALRALPCVCDLIEARPGSGAQILGAA